MDQIGKRYYFGTAWRPRLMGRGSERKCVSQHLLREWLREADAIGAVWYDVFLPLRLA